MGREIAQDRLRPPLGSLLRVSDQQAVSVDSGARVRTRDGLHERGRAAALARGLRQAVVHQAACLFRPFHALHTIKSERKVKRVA